MIPGYQRFVPPPPATTATPATSPELGSKISEGSSPGSLKNWDYQIIDWAPERAAIMQYDGNLSRAEAERRCGIR